ncbi:zinc finger protein OZF-like [Cydia pomonella]|uniref:zinc finger protein OZF-like n=1 Tax=Cydia pomonella TaxID=82600 RepID=UPI002ADE3A83|nr:zinc finger protein OZF-like [Cydia pomonella]
MDVMHACRCCLRCPPDKDLTTPYTYLGKTEIYTDMIKECFDVNLVLSGSGSCGICWGCVGRLRDARDFKLQVQRSQAELQARLQGKSVKEDESSVEPEYPDMQDEDGTSEPVAGDEPPVKPEPLDGWIDGTPDEILYDMLRLNKAAGDGASAEDEPLMACSDGIAARAREQLAMPCSVVLERLRGDATVQSGDKPYGCEQCGKRFNNKYILSKHIQHTHLSSGPKEFPCELCSSTFKTESLMLEHEKIEHGVTDFTCAKCEYTTINKRRLQAHLKTHIVDELFNCTDCSYKSQFKSDLLKHQAIHAGDQKTHERTYVEKPFHKCSYCDYKTRHKGHLHGHMRIHTGAMYTCNHCDRKFYRKSNLQSHQMMHTGEKPFKCSECDYRCRQTGSLLQHQRIHTGEKPYTCSYCEYKCRTRTTLRNHETTHTGEKPFQCSHCDYKCSRKAFLTRHQKRRHSNRLSKSLPQIISPNIISQPLFRRMIN